MSTPVVEAEVERISHLPMTVEVIKALISADPEVKKAMAYKLALAIPQLEDYLGTLKAAFQIANS
jgi:hypothetical protein